MKTKLIAITLFAVTAGAILFYPVLSAKQIHNARVIIPVEQTVQQAIARSQAQSSSQPMVDVVFVLDTTGSMAGLIHTAKEKIWSIAQSMSSAKPTPLIRIGLVAYRDRGDEYVTRVVDLSTDLDSVYAQLMDFEADGGGDTPESVNQALNDAVNKLSWSQESGAYRTIFLVGDAPPHMDYKNEARFPEILARATQKGIVVNTIQCGDLSTTAQPWTQIASLGRGNFFQVEQAGSAVAYTTPFDKKIAALSARLDDTRLFYGNEEDKQSMRKKVAASDKLHRTASVESRARRGRFNSSGAGRKNFLGKNELVEAVSSGEVKLDELDKDALPAALQALAPKEQLAAVQQLAVERSELEVEIRDLAEERTSYLKKKVADAGGAKDSLDQKIYDTMAKQAKEAGIGVEDKGPEY